jgi:hypothetical protein
MSVDEREKLSDALDRVATEADALDAWGEKSSEASDPLNFVWTLTHLDSASAARRAGFLDGVLSGFRCDLNPWKEEPFLFFDESALDALRADSTRTANDFWRAIENLRHQLDELPDEVRDRLVDLISDHLRSGSSR